MLQYPVQTILGGALLLSVALSDDKIVSSPPQFPATLSKFSCAVVAPGYQEAILAGVPVEYNSFCSADPAR